MRRSPGPRPSPGPLPPARYADVLRVGCVTVRLRPAPPRRRTLLAMSWAAPEVADHPEIARSHTFGPYLACPEKRQPHRWCVRVTAWRDAWCRKTIQGLHHITSEATAFRARGGGTSPYAGLRKRRTMANIGRGRWRSMEATFAHTTSSPSRDVACSKMNRQEDDTPRITVS